MMVDWRRVVSVDMKRSEPIPVIFWRWSPEVWLKDRSEGKRGIKDKFA